MCAGNNPSVARDPKGHHEEVKVSKQKSIARLTTRTSGNSGPE